MGVKQEWGFRVYGCDGCLDGDAFMCSHESNGDIYQALGFCETVHYLC